MYKITFIALNLTHNLDYERQDFESQLDNLSRCIMLSYLEAKKKHPDNKVIVAWREYGLCNGKPLTESETGLFKKRMALLTQKRDIIIIAGTILSKKVIQSDRHVDKITAVSEAYKRYSFISDLERNNQQERTFEKYKNNFIRNMSKENFLKVKNTCYIFSDGSKKYKRNKIAPYSEVSNKIIQDFTYGFSEQTWMFNFEEGNKLLDLSIEVCLEHSIGLLKYLVSSGQICAPKIHLILADSNTFEPDYACGDITIRIDSDPDDSINVVVANNKQFEDFIVYQVDPYSPKTELKLIQPTLLNYPKL